MLADIEEPEAGALMIPPFLARLRAEERLLRTQFGSEYDASLCPHGAADSAAVLAGHGERAAPRMESVCGFV